MEPENNPGFLSKAKLESVSVPVEGFQKTAGQRQCDVGYTLLYVQMVHSTCASCSSFHCTCHTIMTMWQQTGGEKCTLPLGEFERYRILPPTNRGMGRGEGRQESTRENTVSCQVVLSSHGSSRRTGLSLPTQSPEVSNSTQCL